MPKNVRKMQWNSAQLKTICLIHLKWVICQEQHLDLKRVELISFKQ